MIRRCTLTLIFAALTYLGTCQAGPVGWYIQDVLTPPTAQNGYSGYTMYERCHIDNDGVMHDGYTGRKDC